MVGTRRQPTALARARPRAQAVISGDGAQDAQRHGLDRSPVDGADLLGVRRGRTRLRAPGWRPPGGRLADLKECSSSGNVPARTSAKYALRRLA